MNTNRLREETDRIKVAFDSADTARNVFDENRGKLSYDEARALSEAAFESNLYEMDDETRALVYDYAFIEVYDYEISDKKANWMQVFNEYASYMRVVTLVRESDSPELDVNDHHLAKEVLESSNPVSTAAGIFRKNRNMSEIAGRKVLEACYPVSLNTLDEAARMEIFNHAYERHSAEGWGAVASAYSESVELAAIVKLPIADREEVKQYRISRDSEKAARNKRFLEQ